MKYQCDFPHLEVHFGEASRLAQSFSECSLNAIWVASNLWSVSKDWKENANVYNKLSLIPSLRFTYIW